jgi:hypothetical protein
MNVILPKPLMDLVHSVHQEIAKHKWIESEKAGRDIGSQRALEDWLQFHFPQWARHEKNRAIEQALYAQDQRLLRQ